VEDWELRIHEILGEDSERSEENAMRFSSHLTGNLRLPVKVTGREDFPWEEPYVLGGWSRTEYARLKKDNPSFTDSFELLELLPSAENDDVQAKIKRISDRKVFTIGLSWLQAEDESSKKFTLLDDYGMWHANY